jgi:hypothetical protein
MTKPGNMTSITLAAALARHASDKARQALHTRGGSNQERWCVAHLVSGACLDDRYVRIIVDALVAVSPPPLLGLLIKHKLAALALADALLLQAHNGKQAGNCVLPARMMQCC